LQRRAAGSYQEQYIYKPKTKKMQTILNFKHKKTADYSAVFILAKTN